MIINVINDTDYLRCRKSKIKLEIDIPKIKNYITSLGYDIFSLTVNRAVIEFDTTKDTQYKKILCDSSGIYECLETKNSGDLFIERRNYILIENLTNTRLTA
jgi:hypothetical protein